MPRCLNDNCKEKFIPKYFLQKYCMEKDECIKAMAESAKEQEYKKQKKVVDKQKEDRAPYVYPKKYKSYMNDECQKLARMIDARFGFITCIDCGKPFGKQCDGGHFNSKGKNPTIAWNLHNIHSQKSDCNQNGLGGGRERQYYDGLISRYGIEYAEMVDTGLQKKYTYLGMTEGDVAEKLAIVRKLIRDFDTYQFTDSVQARYMCNKIIGIYT